MKLDNIDEMIIEKFLQMEDWYVLNFTTNGFKKFVYDAIQIDIYWDKYKKVAKSEWKANILRSFIKIENSYTIWKLLQKFWEYKRIKVSDWIIKSSNFKVEFEDYKKIVSKLLWTANISNLDEIVQNDNEEFKLLKSEVQKYINQNSPELWVDRLHTYLIKFLRIKCEENNININKDETLTKILKKYINFLKWNGLIKSTMTYNILIYSWTILDSFNNVRNNNSFAHDNKILNYNEANLIYNNIISFINFINRLNKNSV